MSLFCNIFSITSLSKSDKALLRNYVTFFCFVLKNQVFNRYSFRNTATMKQRRIVPMFPKDIHSSKEPQKYRHLFSCFLKSLLQIGSIAVLNNNELAVFLLRCVNINTVVV